MSAPDAGGAIFVLPTTTVGQQGPVAGWISTSGWAAAAARVLGQAWIITRDGVLTVDEVRRRASLPGSVPPPASRPMRRAVPPVVKTAVKDAREARRARAFRPGPVGPWTQAPGSVAFVWQRHELFHRGGLELASSLGVPSVLFVPALTVWQAERWAVRRPGWGRWLEQRGELPALRAASLLACGTDVIAEQVARLGIPDDRVLVTPTGVDLALFDAPVDRGESRRALGVDDSFVIGWAGSFRAFHQLDQLVEAAAAVPGAMLLLVGDGPERARIEALARARQVPTRATGMVAHDDLPRVLAAMDVGVVLARPDVPFHYSPLKVAEYLAAGVPVAAPDVPQLTQRLVPEGNAVIVAPGDVEALAAALRALASDPDRRDRLAAGARAAAPEWSWDRQVERVQAALTARRLP